MFNVEKIIKQKKKRRNLLFVCAPVVPTRFIFSVRCYQCSSDYDALIISPPTANIALPALFYFCTVNSLTLPFPLAT